MEHESLPPGGLRIALVQRLTGVGVHTLRAWERRYGVPRPARTEGGQRLYTVDDVDLVKRMHGLAEAGVALSRAAQTAIAEHAVRQATQPADGGTARIRTRLLQALLRFDDRAAHAAWAEALERRDILAVFDEVAAPVLVDTGDAWHAGRVTEAQEHFASGFLRSRIDALARSVHTVEGAPLVLLACAESEAHELGLSMVNVLVRYQGLATVYLGANLPAEALLSAARELRPALIGLSASTDAAAASIGAVARRLREEIPGAAILAGGRAFREGSAAPGEGFEVAPPSLRQAVERIARICRPMERPRAKEEAS
ncbi:MAG: cobalamin-dependent protein [Dehalococcoidia bacterium]|nr:cobalamin-dependent protein [Dehalococcoidia bacterium]